MPKVFIYRGKTLEELKKLSVKEFAQLLPSQRKRKILRGLTDAEKIFLKKIEKKDNVKTHCRDMIILPGMVGKKVLVHNGKNFNLVMIQEEMMGHLLGEFVLTRSKVTHSSPGVGATRSSAAISVK